MYCNINFMTQKRKAKFTIDAMIRYQCILETLGKQYVFSQMKSHYIWVFSNFFYKFQNPIFFSYLNLNLSLGTSLKKAFYKTTQYLYLILKFLQYEIRICRERNNKQRLYTNSISIKYHYGQPQTQLELLGKLELFSKVSLIMEFNKKIFQQQH